MNYVDQMSSAIEMFRKLNENLHSSEEMRKIAAAENAENDVYLAEILIAMLENKDVSLKSFNHPAKFADVDKRERLANFVQFNAYIQQRAGEKLDSDVIDFIFRRADVQEWEMYADILGNRFSLAVVEEPKPEPVVTIQQPRKPAPKKYAKKKQVG